MRRHIRVKVEAQSESVCDTPVIAVKKEAKEYADASLSHQDGVVANEIESISGKAPRNWEQVLNNIRVMRAVRDAPVDRLGCEVLADPAAPPEVQRFHVLVALLLSSQVGFGFPCRISVDPCTTAPDLC